MKIRALLGLVGLSCLPYGSLSANELTVWVWQKHIEKPAVFSLKLSDKGQTKQMQGDYRKIEFPVLHASTAQTPERVDIQSMDVFTGMTIVAEFRTTGIGVTLEHSSLVDDSGQPAEGAKNLMLRSLEFLTSHQTGERHTVATSPDHPVVQKIEYRITSRENDIL
jgi:hypothetical protein